MSGCCSESYDTHFVFTAGEMVAVSCLFRKGFYLSRSGEQALEIVQRSPDILGQLPPFYRLFDKAFILYKDSLLWAILHRLTLCLYT